MTITVTDMMTGTEVLHQALRNLKQNPAYKVARRKYEKLVEDLFEKRAGQWHYQAHGYERCRECDDDINRMLRLEIILLLDQQKVRNPVVVCDRLIRQHLKMTVKR